MTMFDLPDLSKSTVSSMVVYGPPRTRRGRMANRIRRLLRMEERADIYAYAEPSVSENAMRVTWDARGVMRIEGDR